MARLELIVDSSRAEQGFRRAEQAGDRYQRSARGVVTRTEQMRGAFGRLREGLFSFKGVLAGLGLGVAISQLQRFVTSATDAANAIDKASQTAGVGAEALQELRFAFGQMADVTDQQVDTSLQRFNRRLGLAADGAGAAANTFGELGIAMEDAGGRMRGTEAVLNDAIRELAAIESESRRAAKASELFGEEAGPRLAAALSQGSGAFTQLREDAQDLGIVLDDELVSNAAEMADEFDKLTRILSVQFQSAVLENKETILGLVEGFGDLIDAASRGDLLPNFFTRAEEGARGFRTELEKAARIVFAFAGAKALGSRALRGGPVAGAVGAAGGAIGGFFLPDLISGLSQALGEEEKGLEQLSAQLDVLEEKRNEIEQRLAGSEGETGAAILRVREQDQRKLEATKERIEEITGAMDDLRESMEITVTAEKPVDVVGSMSSALREAKKEARENLAQLDPLVSATQEYGESVQILANNLAIGNIGQERFNELLAEQKSQLRDVLGLTSEAQRQADLDMMLLDQAEATREYREEQERLGVAVDENTGLVVDFGVKGGKSIRQLEAETADLEARMSDTLDMDRAFLSMLDNIQDAWGDTFADMFRGELDSFEDFADSIKDIWARTMGELAAQQLMQPFQAAAARQMGMTNDQMEAQGINPNASFGGMFQGGGFSAGGMASGAATGLAMGQGSETSEGRTLSLVGGVLGSYFGPIGQAIGSAAGSAFGDAVGPQMTEFANDNSEIFGNAGGPFNFDLFGGRIGDPLDILPDVNPFSAFESRPNSEWFRILTGTNNRRRLDGGEVFDEDAQTPLTSTQGPFGRVGISRREDLNSNDMERAQQIVQSVAGLDQQLAAVLGEGLTEVGREALAGTITHVDSWLEGDRDAATGNLTDALIRRYQEVLGAIDEDLAQSLGEVEGATPENLGQLAGALFTLNEAGIDLPDTATGIIELAGEFTTLRDGIEQLNRSAMTASERSLSDFNDATMDLRETFSDLDVSIPRSRDAFLSLLNGLDLTTEQGREMADSLLGVSGAFQRTIGVIEDVSRSIAEITESTSDSIRRQLETDQQTYRRLREQIEEQAMGLSDIQDPTRLRNEIEAISRQARDAFSLLNPEQQQSMGPGFLEFMDELNAEGQEALAGLRDEITSQGADMSEAASVIANSTNNFSVQVNAFGATVNNMGSVVNQLASALNTIPSQINVNITQESAEVG